MILDAALRIMKDPVKDAHQSPDLYGDGQLLLEFPGQGLQMSLPQFHQPAGEAPSSPAWLLISLTQPYGCLIKNHRRHPNQGMLWIFSFHFDLLLFHLDKIESNL